ncbi:11553_t:CDS:2 [Rhizophagus irregularis]|nr:11553_t:CDS:2 [Rhizophagus irregularis]
MRKGSNLQEFVLFINSRNYYIDLPKFSIFTIYKPGITNLTSLSIEVYFDLVDDDKRYQNTIEFLSNVSKFCNCIINCEFWISNLSNALTKPFLDIIKLQPLERILIDTYTDNYIEKENVEKVIHALEFRSKTLKQLLFRSLDFQLIDLSFLSKLEYLENLEFVQCRDLIIPIICHFNLLKTLKIEIYDGVVNIVNLVEILADHLLFVEYLILDFNIDLSSFQYFIINCKANFKKWIIYIDNNNRKDYLLHVNNYQKIHNSLKILGINKFYNRDFDWTNDELEVIGYLKDQGKTSFVDTFAVNIAKESDILGSLVKFDDLKISDLKYLIYNLEINGTKFNYKNIGLWKVDIAYDKNRCFCPANRLDPENNFYVKPKELVENLGNCIVEGKFCLFYGHRQSGKTTTAWELKRWIETNSKYTVCYLNFNSGIVTNKGLSEFWRFVCFKVKSVMSACVDKVVFSTLLKEKIEASAFEKIFNKDNTSLRDIILIIDEASRLINDNDETSQPIINDFIASLRVLRDQRGDISIVHSVVLIGTKVIKNFLFTQTQQSKNSTSEISPFSAEGVFNSAQFTNLEVKNLLAQYAEDNKFEIDVDNIAADVYSFTLGHKGLVGACYYYFEQKIMSEAIQATLDDWEKHVPILENEREILEEVLRYGNKKVSMDEDDVKFLLAEGMVVVISNYEDGTDFIGCAAPIFHTIMLSSICGPNIVLSSLPTNADHIEPKWLLARTIEVNCCSKLFIVSNETVCIYLLRTEFLSVFKQLISIAYPSFEYCVLPEVKECDEGGRRHQPSETVFDNRLKCSEYYSSIHNCNKMYTIDISSSEKHANYFGKQNYEKFIETWCRIFNNNVSFHNQFPNLTKLVELALVGPVSNGIVENVDSDIKFSLTPFIKWT